MASAKVKDFKDYQGPTSREYTVDIDLANGDTISQRMWFDFLSCKTISISVQLIGATGTSGDITAEYAGFHRGKGFAYTTPISLTVVDNDTVNGIVPEHLSRYCLVDLTGITWGLAGKVRLVVTGKPH